MVIKCKPVLRISKGYMNKTQSAFALLPFALDRITKQTIV